MAKKNNNWLYALVAVVIIVAGGVFTASELGLIGGKTVVVEENVEEGEQVYTPFTLQHLYVYAKDNADKDVAFGADDVYGRIYNKGEFDFSNGDPVDSDTGSAATTGQLDFAGVKVMSNTQYDMLLYQGDGGTAIYPKMVAVSIPKLNDEATSTTYTNVPNTIYLDKEGNWTESTFDSTDATLDEAGDVVYLNQTADAIEGCLTWDATVDDAGSGSVILEPVYVFRDSSASPMADSNDIEHIYLSLKTGSGVGFYDCDTGSAITGDAVAYFSGEEPICLTSDGRLDPQDAATVTVKICFPASEADTGTGSFELVQDDMGDVRAKSLNNDVQTAAETTTFTLYE